MLNDFSPCIGRVPVTVALAGAREGRRTCVARSCSLDEVTVPTGRRVEVSADGRRGLVPVGVIA